MIILRQKEFASTKESREKSKERNKKDNTRKALNTAQGVTAVGALGTSIGTTMATKKAMKKLSKQAAKKGVYYDGGLIMGPRKVVEAVERLDKRIAKNAKKGNKVALGLAGASLGLGTVKLARDIKAKKKENK